MLNSKNTIFTTLAVALSLAFASCNAVDAVNATKTMPDEMHAMQARMDITNQKMDQTNAGMAATNAGMAKTNSGIHKQTLKLSLDDLIYQNINVEYLDLPIRMIPGGKMFAEEATALELAEISYAYIKEIEELGDASISPEQKTKLDQEKLVKLVALEILASFAPQSTIDQIIVDQINNQGQYLDTALAILALRATFTKSFRLDTELLDGGKIRTVGGLIEAENRANILEDILKLPFAAQVHMTVKGFSNPDYNQEISVDKALLVDVYSKILTASASIAPNYSGQASSAFESAADHAANRQKFNDAEALALAKQKEWSGK